MTELQERIAAAIKADPERSNRHIAEKIGCDKNSVIAVRRKLESEGTIPRVDHVVDSLGRLQPASDEAPLEAPRAVESLRSSAEWRATIETLEQELTALDAEIAELKAVREKAALAAAAGDEAAKRTLGQATARLGAREQRRADAALILEAARQQLGEAEAREEAEWLAELRREVQRLGAERLKAAERVDKALRELADALAAYKDACTAHARMGEQAGLDRRKLSYNQMAVSFAAGAVLHSFLPDLRYVPPRYRRTLAERDAAVLAATIGGNVDEGVV